jgi:hypothetical protein
LAPPGHFVADAADMPQIKLSASARSVFIVIPPVETPLTRNYTSSRSRARAKPFDGSTTARKMAVRIESDG